MANLTRRGTPLTTNGDVPEAGTCAPGFTLTDEDLVDRTLQDYSGLRKLVYILPSLDTPTCELSTIKLNDIADSLENTIILIVSADLPFAQKRFCSHKNTDKVRALSMMRDRRFAKDYGVLIQDGPLAGITARAVVVIDENGTIVHSQLVPDLDNAPDYLSALEAVKS